VAVAYARILVGTDGSPTAAVAERVATALAKASGGELVLVSAFTDADDRVRAEEAVATARELGRGAGVSSHTEVVEGEPAAAITETADRGDADLIVVGDVGMGGPKRFRLGGVADRVSHDMPCDLLIVRTSKGERQGEPGAYRRVLLATDGSPTADRAVRVGAEFAETMGAAVALVHVGEELMGTIILRDTAQRLGAPDAPVQVAQGDPGERIAELAGAEGHDLVVVGNKGMAGTLRFLLGVVPDKVSHLAPCDVLIVNTVGRSLEDLDPGEGAIVLVGRKKVAAYREESGELVTLSPKCKHLGCTVGWNHRSKTWDCPCHGSRYDARGKVIRGPAQRDLDPTDAGA
jgi:nucleotide-binding universal stress UspA family protein/nitrite reductase/ring-hydroxylating ferredoxin subunit